MERLAIQVQATQKVLQLPETHWNERCNAIEELATAVESLEHRTDYKDVVCLLRNLSIDLGAQLTSIRSRLVKDVCEHLIRIVLVTKRDFQDMANALLPPLLSTSKSVSSAIRQPGAKLLSQLSENVRYDLALVRKIYVQSTQDRLRVLVLEQLRIVFVYWSEDEMFPWESDVLEMVRLGFDDQNETVRKAAREVLCRLASRWCQRVDELLEMLSNRGKRLLIQEHRESPLAAAILKKYPELASKADILSRNKAPLSQTRTSFPKYHRQKSEQNIEIHVPAAPPPKQRQEQEEWGQTKLNSNGETAKRSTTAAALEETKSSADEPRLPENPDITVESDHYQQHSNPEVFVRSPIRRPHSSHESARPHAPEVVKTSSLQAGIHRPPFVERAAGASNVDETILQHSSVRQIENRHSPDPLSRTLTSYGERHHESPMRSIFSEARSPVLSRHEKLSLSLQESIRLSTPVGSVDTEEVKVESNLSSASDDFFNKRIPSSNNAPTSIPASTANVTLRSRRRTSIYQEQDNLLPQISSAVLAFSKLTVPEESSQPRSTNATPEPVVSRSQSIHEVTSSLREHYSDSVFDCEDGIDHFTAESDRAEPYIEWDHRNLDNSRSHSEGDSQYLEADDDQLGLRVEDSLPDEWHLDDEVSPSRVIQNEVGNLMSGNFGGIINDDETATANELKVSESILDAGSSLQGQCVIRNGTEEEKNREAELSVDVESQSLSTDALTGLENIQKEMTRLRAITDSGESRGSRLVNKGSMSARSVLDTTDVVEEVQESFTPKQEDQLWHEPRRSEKCLERLTCVDDLSEGTLLVPNADTACIPPNESSNCDQLPDPLTLARGLYQSTKHSGGAMETNSFTPLSPLRTADHGCENTDEPGFLDFAENDRAENMEALSQSLQKGVQRQGLFDAHEQAERFHAAEKLFASKEPTQSFYSRPQLPKPERYMHSDPHRARLPPTRLEAKLNPSYAKPQKEVVEDKSGRVTKNVTPEDVTTAVEEENMAGAAVEENKKVLLEGCQPVTSLDKTSAMPAPDCTERDASRLSFDSAPCATTKSSAVAQEVYMPPPKLGWASSFAITVVVFLAAMFCMMGILEAAKKVQDSHEYHLALKARIGKFEASITETHKKVLKLEEDYAVWSEYVRKLTEEDEVHALAQLEAIQAEVQKWQHDMKGDLVAFRQALSVDTMEASFADLHMNTTKESEQ